MCNIKRQHQEFKRRYNKVDSNHNKDFAPAFIDDMLYEAALDYVDIFGGNNMKKQLMFGFEEIQLRTDMLFTLVKRLSNLDYLSPVLTSQEFGLSKYTFDLPLDYMHLARPYAVSKNCGQVSIDIKSHNLLDLNDSYQRPNLTWKRLIGVFRDGKLVVYSDGELLGINGEYIKIPTKPFVGGYNTLEYINGDASFPQSTSAPINMDIPEPYCDVVVDIAVENVSGSLGDLNNVNYLQNKTLKTF